MKATLGKRLSIIDADIDFIRTHGMCGYRDLSNPAFQRKLLWLEQQFRKGLKVRFLRSDDTGVIGSIEYMPGEYAWRRISAPGYIVIHCIFIMKKDFKGKGYGLRLIKACEKDASTRKFDGVATVCSKSTWMANKKVFLRSGYEYVEEASPHYELLVKRFNPKAPLPQFVTEELGDDKKGLRIYYSDQCPYITKTMDEIPGVARDEFGIEPTLAKLENYRQAQNSPSPYGVFGIIQDGLLVADHPISATRFRNIMKKLPKPA
jgi:hypothetical protein